MNEFGTERMNAMNERDGMNEFHAEMNGWMNQWFEWKAKPSFQKNKGKKNSQIHAKSTLLKNRRDLWLAAKAARIALMLHKSPWGPQRPKESQQEPMGGPE